MRILKLSISLIVLTLVVFPLGVGAVSSTSYQIIPEAGFLSPSADGYANTDDMLNSTNYQLQGAIESYAGKPTSASYKNESGSSFQYYCGDGFIDPGETCDGSALNGATCSSQGFASGTLTCSSSCALVTSACNAGGGGGGGGGGGSSAAVPDAPGVGDTIKTLGFSYKNSFLLFGTNSSTTTSLKVNDLTTGVTFPTTTSWQKTVSLAYGLNTFKIIASNSTGNSTETVYELYRRLIGDMTQDSKVNDYDLSKLVKLWGGKDRGGDFNDDGSVNDYDFSMMVARWGTSV